MKDDDKTLGWLTTSDSASGMAHFWTKEKYSRRRSLCGRVTEAKAVQSPSQTIGECARCKKVLEAKARLADFGHEIEPFGYQMTPDQHLRLGRLMEAEKVARAEYTEASKGFHETIYVKAYR